MIYVACNTAPSSSSGTDTSKATTAAVTEPAITMPYTAGYSSNFSPGKQEDALTVLNSYKAWENGDMAALAATFADSIAINFPDGSKFYGTRDSAIGDAKKYRDGISSVKIDMDAWIPMHNNDKNEDWVLVWYKEIDTRKNGKTDSTYYHDLNLIKSGKIAFIQSMAMQYKK